MKLLIVLVVGLLAVGCGKPEKPLEPSQPDPSLLPTNAPPTPIDQNTTKAEPVKELTEEEKNVIGEYELKYRNGDTWKNVFLDNGIREYYKNDEKVGGVKWSIVKGEIQVDVGYYVQVYRINKDKSITYIASISDGKRTDLSKEFLPTFKKIK